MIEDDLTDKEIGKAILFSRFLFNLPRTIGISAIFLFSCLPNGVVSGVKHGVNHGVVSGVISI